MQLKWTAVALAALTLVACGKKKKLLRPPLRRPRQRPPHLQRLRQMH